MSEQEAPRTQFCTNCGTPYFEGAIRCNKCKALFEFQKKAPTNTPKTEDKSNYDPEMARKVDAFNEFLTRQGLTPLKADQVSKIINTLMPSEHIVLANQNMNTKKKSAWNGLEPTTIIVTEFRLLMCFTDSGYHKPISITDIPYNTIDEINRNPEYSSVYLCVHKIGHNLNKNGYIHREYTTVCDNPILDITPILHFVKARLLGLNPSLPSTSTINQPTRPAQPGPSVIRPVEQPKSVDQQSAESTITHLERLRDLLKDGTLTRDEFNAAKKKLLGL